MPMLHYAASVYEDKISELETYNNRLNQHKETLIGLRDRVKNYWDDDAAETYYNTLSTQIRAVNNASERIANLKHIYQEAVDDLSRTKSTVKEAVSDAEQIVKSLGIE